MNTDEHLKSDLQSLRDSFDNSVAEPFQFEERGDFLRYVIFELNSELYAWPAEFICEIVSSGRVIPIPGRHPYLTGVTNYRNQILSVIDLQSLLGLSVESVQEEDGEKTLLVTKNLTVDTALCIQRLKGILTVEASQVIPRIPSIEKGVAKYLFGELYYKNQLVTLFNPQEIEG